MNLKITSAYAAEMLIGGVCIVTWTLLQSFVGTVYAVEKKVEQHENKLVGVEAIRPQVQDILMKVDSMDKAIREIRDTKCHFKKEK